MNEKLELLNRIAIIERQMLESILNQHHNLHNAMKLYTQYKDIISQEKLNYFDKAVGECAWVKNKSPRFRKRIGDCGC